MPRTTSLTGDPPPGEPDLASLVPRLAQVMPVSLASQPLPRAEVVCGVAVLLIALKVVWSASQAHDLSLWDETLYLARGVRLGTPGFPNDERGLPPPEWGPLYSLFYAALHLIEHDNVRLFFTAWSVVVVLTHAGIYALGRALGASPTAALVAAACAGATSFFQVAPYPSLFAGLILLGAALLVVRAGTLRARFRWALLGFLLATFVRPELFGGLAIAVFAGAVCAVTALRARRVRVRSVLLEVAIFGGAAALLYSAFGNPSSSERAFFAFGQHYALSIVLRDHLDVDPWPNWVRYFQDDFGDAKTVSEALRANPGAFLAHVWANATRAPRSFAETFEPRLMLGEAVRPTIRDLFAVLLWVGFLPALPMLWQDGRRRAVLLPVVALAATTSLSILLVHPRFHYFQPMGVFLFAFGAVGFPGAIGWLRQRMRRASQTEAPSGRSARLGAGLTAALTLLLVPNPAHGWCVQSAVLGAPAPLDLPIEKTIATLRSLALRDHVVVLEKEWGCAFYAGLDYQRVDEWSKHEPFDAFVKRLGISVVVVTDWLAKDDGFGKDPAYQAFLDDPAALGFRVVPVKGTKRWIAVRNDVR